MVGCWNLLSGDCRSLLAGLKARGVKFDSCVTDAPYEINFMSRKWDNTGIAFDPDTWRAVYDVLKPGAYLVAFGGCRSHHRMWCAIEDAGFTIVDTLMWLFGSGMPKSHNVSLAMDKTQGAKREIAKVITRPRPMFEKWGETDIQMADREPITDDAKQWRGFGSSLKPSYEPIILAQKPRDGTIVQNVLKHGTGALNIDACKVGNSHHTIRGGGGGPGTGWGKKHEINEDRIGTYPANILHDGSDEVEAAFGLFGDHSGGTETDYNWGLSDNQDNPVKLNNNIKSGVHFCDSGSVSRYFQSCKFTKEELRFLYTSKAGDDDRAWSRHTTVKPLELMHWLTRLVTPPGGNILDPFCGSGTTLQAAVEQGFNAVGCEITPEYITDIERRMATFCGWYPRRDPFVLPRRPLPVPQRTRRPNRISSHKPEDTFIPYELTRDEFETLHWNMPGPTGKKGGGYQQLENRLITKGRQHPKTTATKVVIELDMIERDRVTRCVQGYGPGGPNGRIRKALHRFFRAG